MITLQINGQRHHSEADPAMPLLWTRRVLIGLTGTKYSHGISYGLTAARKGEISINQGRAQYSPLPVNRPFAYRFV